MVYERRRTSSPIPAAVTIWYPTHFLVELRVSSVVKRLKLISISDYARTLAHRYFPES